MNEPYDPTEETSQIGVTPVQEFHSRAVDPKSTEPRTRLGRPKAEGNIATFDLPGSGTDIGEARHSN